MSKFQFSLWSISFCIFVLVGSGCSRDSIIVELHVQSEISPLSIVADKTTGQPIKDNDGVVAVWFNADGIAKVESFDFLAKWHKKRVIVDGVPRPNVRILDSQLDLKAIKAIDDGGGVSYRSIENESTRTFTLAYK